MGWDGWIVGIFGFLGVGFCKCAGYVDGGGLGLVWVGLGR